MNYKDYIPYADLEFITRHPLYNKRKYWGKGDRKNKESVEELIRYFVDHLNKEVRYGARCKVYFNVDKFTWFMVIHDVLLARLTMNQIYVSSLVWSDVIEGYKTYLIEYALKKGFKVNFVERVDF